MSLMETRFLPTPKFLSYSLKGYFSQLSCKFLEHNCLFVCFVLSYSMYLRKKMKTRAEREAESFQEILNINRVMDIIVPTKPYHMSLEGQSQVCKVLDGVYIEFAKEEPSFFSDIWFLVSLLIIRNVTRVYDTWAEITKPSNKKWLPQKETSGVMRGRESKEITHSYREMPLGPGCCQVTFPPNPGSQMSTDSSSQGSRCLS